MSKHSRYVVLSLLLFSVFFFAVDAARADTVRVPLPESSVTVGVGQDGSVLFEGEKLQFPGQVGEPNLPYRVLKILLPPDADLEMVSVSLENVVEAEVGCFWDVQPVPPMATWDGEKAVVAWPEGRNIEDGRDVDIYGTNVFFPLERTLPARTGEIRGWKVVDVPVALFRYNPVTRKLMRLEAVDVVVDYSGSGSKSSVGGTADSIAPDLVRDAVVNYDDMASSYTGQSGSTRTSGEEGLPGYVIVTTQAIRDASDSFDAFVTHKEALGFNVEVVTDDEWGLADGVESADRIRNWLADNYLALNVEYVLLVGNPHPESGDVPMKMLWPRNNAIYNEKYKESPSDLYYADLTGNWDLDGDGFYGEWGDDFGDGGIDTNWDIVVGRIPVYGSIADLDAILAKTIRYETADPATTEWRNNVLLPMKPSDTSTPGYQLGEAIKDDVLVPLGYDGYTRVYDENYGLDPAPDYTPCTMDNVTEAWTEKDFGYVAWWTHGNVTVAGEIMDVDHVPFLDDSHPAIVFQCSCLNATPERSDNLSYSLLKSGAVVTIGATRVSWYRSGQTEYAGSGTNAGMAYRISGELITNGTDGGTALASVKQEIYAASATFWMNFTGFNVYGDPSLGLGVPGPSFNSVTVNIEGPPEARWSLDRGTGHESGYTAGIVSAGTHDLSYSDVDGWVKPSTSALTVSEGDPAVVTATYRKRILEGPTFVKPGGGGDGTSWDSPRDLADALRDAVSGEKILVAEGVYLPKYDGTNNPPLTGGERESTFTLKSGVTLYGGFPANLAGTASSGRDPLFYRTVLTGDLGGDDEADGYGIVADTGNIQGDNACHVVSCSGVSDVTLYGFTVTAGRSDVGGFGGGLNCVDSSLKVSDCTFAGNFAHWYGGGMRIACSQVSLRDCAFHGNVSGMNGGGMDNNRSQVSLRGCSFHGNASSHMGGGAYSFVATLSLIDCTFFANEATDAAAILNMGGSSAMKNCTFASNVATADGSALLNIGQDLHTVTNCLFWDDTAEEIAGEDPIISHCVVRGGLDGIASSDHIITDDPCLGPLTDNGGSTQTCVLLPESSALDAGTPEGVPSADQRGVARPQGIGVDIGACEVRPGAVRAFIHGPASALWSLNGDGNYGNGHTVGGLQIGSYPVTFASVPGWNAPVSMDVTVTEGATRLVAGDYGLAVSRPASWSDEVEAGDGVTLTWEPFAFLGDSVTYEVYMLVDGVYVPVPSDQVDGTSVTLDLNGHTTYTLRVDADGFEGQPWNVTTANRVPRLARRSPVNGADRLPVDTALSWFYIDPDGDLVDTFTYMNDGSPESVALSLVCSGDVRTFAPSLSADLDYKWQIVAKDSFDGIENFTQGITSGDVWTFSVTPDVSRITPPLSDDVLIACGVNDIWVATLNSADLAALGDGFIPAETVLSMDVAPLSCDLSSADRQEFLEGSGTSLVAALPEGFRLAVSVSDDVNLVPVPVTVSFTEKQVGRTLSEETLLDDVHIFVVVGGTPYDLVTLAGGQRDSLFSVTSDVDESGVTYFVSFRLFLAAGPSGKTLGAAAADGASLFTDTKDPAFLVEGASPQAGRFEATVAEATVNGSSGSGSGGCSAFAFGPGAVLLFGSVFFLIKRK